MPAPAFQGGRRAGGAGGRLSGRAPGRRPGGGRRGAGGVGHALRRPRPARKRKRIYGSFFGSTDPHREFPRLLALYRAGKLLLDELVSAHYRLDQINEAYADLLKGGHKRGVILFDSAA